MTNRGYGRPRSLQLTGDLRAFRDGDVPAGRLRIEPQARDDALLRQRRPPEAEHLDDFNHPDLAIHPGPPATGHSPGLKTIFARSDEGERF